MNLTDFSDHQYGFLKERSTDEILSYFTNVWLSFLRDFGESYVVAPDILKFSEGYGILPMADLYGDTIAYGNNKNRDAS